MDPASIDFFNIQQGPLDQAYADRVIDWLEDGSHILRLESKYEDEYAARVCSKCTKQRMTDRGCVTFVKGGMQRRRCAHMQKATYKRLKKTINAHIWSHPAMSGPKLELEQSGIWSPNTVNHEP